MKRKKWHEKHHEECNAMRARAGAGEGDGLRRLIRMKSGSPAERQMARFLEKQARNSLMSVDMLDAAVSLYASNPSMSWIFGGTLPVDDKIISLNPLQFAAKEWAKTVNEDTDADPAPGTL